jgi:hypothetical protein
MIRDFKFTYQVPPADCIAELNVIIECDCKGFFYDDEPVVIIKNSKFVACRWSDLWNANATDNKLMEAAKQYFVNWVSNAQPMANSEEIVNDILNIQNN